MRSASPVHQARSMTPQSMRSSTFSRPRQDSVTSKASTSQQYHPSGRSSPTSQHTLEQDVDLDEQLNAIWMKASAADNGAMHKDAMDDLWNFINAHPERKAAVDAMIESTGGVFARYIRRALASRQAEHDLRTGTPRTSSEHPETLSVLILYANGAPQCVPTRLTWGTTTLLPPRRLPEPPGPQDALLRRVKNHWPRCGIYMTCSTTVGEPALSAMGLQGALYMKDRVSIILGCKHILNRYGSEIAWHLPGHDLYRRSTCPLVLYRSWISFVVFYRILSDDFFFYPYSLSSMNSRLPAGAPCFPGVKLIVFFFLPQKSCSRPRQFHG